MRYAVLAAIIFFSLPVEGIVQETASFSDFISGAAPESAYDNWISHLSEGIADENYNIYAPYDIQTTGFGDFHLPSDSELEEWESVIALFTEGNYSEAEFELIQYEIPYQIVEFHDTDTDRTYYMLREVLNPEYFDDNGTPDYEADDETGGFDYGWGLFVCDPAASLPVILTVPHPCDDYTTPVISAVCFQEWNASYLLINGAGREVKWTEVGNYSNSKSLSDPSRNEDHPFTLAYQYFCDRIRSEFGRREFSPQIHSYDWYRHANHASCQISAGYSRECPNLPIRDLSDLKIDIINASSYLMVPANTIGGNDAVYLNDYYAVNYSLYDFTFTDDDTTVVVNNNVDLPGYSGNKQMLYSFSGWNTYDVFEPFFHLEMDELPNCYEQTEENWFWFFAYDPELEVFDMEHLFDYTKTYYSSWIEAMTGILPFVLELDDELIPPVPQQLEIADLDYDKVSLSWDPVSSFDFRTYEILYSTHPLGHTDPMIYDRGVKSILASQLCEMITVEDLNGNNQYYFRIRAGDHNGNYSAVSPEIRAYTSPADVTGFLAIGEDDQVSLYWTAVDQIRNLGFNVYRREEGGEWQFLAGYETEPLLQGSAMDDQEYNYLDLSAENGIVYNYQLAAVNNLGTEFFLDHQPECSPNPIFALITSTQNGAVADTSYFAANAYATDGYEPYYDLIETDDPSGDFIYSAFYENFWITQMYFSQETKSLFDPDLDYKTWDLAVATSLIEETLTISISDNYLRTGEKLYLLNEQNEELVDLEQQELTYLPGTADTLHFTLYWGDLEPLVFFPGEQNWIYQTGDIIEFGWNTLFPSLVQSQSISLENDYDSLLVAEHLIGTVNSYNWQIPPGNEIQNARVTIDVFTVNEEHLSFFSSYKLGVVPVQNGISRAGGWSTAASTWPGEIWQASTIFDPGSELYLLEEEEEYQYTDYFSYGAGYWLYTPVQIDFSTDAEIQHNRTIFELFPGWNLLPNPFLADHVIHGLRFIIDDDENNFRQTVQEHLISRGIIKYRNGTYTAADVLEPGESFYLYSYAPETSQFSVVFIPYYESFEFSESYEWKLPLHFRQEGIDRDELILGVSYLTGENFQITYDLPEPPSKPWANSLRAYFPKSDPEFWHDKLNTEFKYPLSNHQAEEKIWDMALDITQDDMIRIWADFSEYPQDYRVRIELEGVNHEILAGDTLLVQPQSSGILEGQVIVQNHLWVDNSNSTIPVREFFNYPNPFNPNTNFSFYLGTDSRVDLTVYNIKGQKVKRIIRDRLSPGQYELAWDGRDYRGVPVASGIYIARLSTEKQTVSRKLILFK